MTRAVHPPGTVLRPELLKQVRARLRAGDSVREAAAALGVSLGTVAGLLRRHGLGEEPCPQRRRVEDTRRLVEAIRAGLRRGLDVAAASRAVGVTDSVGRGLIRRHGRGDAPKATPLAAPLAIQPIEIPGCPREGCCAWPTSDGHPWTFCNRARQPGRPYCAEHLQRAFVRHHSPREGGMALTWHR